MLLLCSYHHLNLAFGSFFKSEPTLRLSRYYIAAYFERLPETTLASLQPL